MRCSWGLVRRLRERAWPTLSRIDFQAPRAARSWRSERSWQRVFREVYGLFSGSSMTVVVAVGCGGFGSGEPAVSMAESSCIWRRRLRSIGSRSYLDLDV